MSRHTMSTVEQDFHKRMHAAGMYGLWELASQMTAHPEPAAIAHMWRAALIEAMVRESGEVVPVGEERRALQLFNPGLGGRWATTNTLIAAVQLLLPGRWPGPTATLRPRSASSWRATAPTPLSMASECTWRRATSS